MTRKNYTHEKHKPSSNTDRYNNTQTDRSKHTLHTPHLKGRKTEQEEKFMQSKTSHA